MTINIGRALVCALALSFCSIFASPAQSDTLDNRIKEIEKERDCSGGSPAVVQLSARQRLVDRGG
jgi:hypothetical protein